MVEEQKEVGENPEESPKAEYQEEGNQNAIAIFSYLGIFLIIPFLVDKDNPFVNYHIKQGLVLLIFAILVGWIPVIGWIASLILAILGIVNVLNGEKKELPLIGKYASKFDI
ncbi:MAG: DUF4870 domain-containing protein [Patescibacteria group bacterium]